jgi:CRISPR system Cascade subunit CasD
VSENNTLFLALEGLQQSYGSRAQWQERDTELWPTHSAITGLLAASLGWADDARIRSLALDFQSGVRIDRPGRVETDFQTVHGLVKVDGGVSHGNLISHRQFLTDAAFLAAVQSTNPLRIAQLAEAVQNPVWCIYLGRKAYVPYRPVFAGVGRFDTLPDALTAAPLLYPSDAPTTLTAYIQTDPGHGERRQDVVKSRKYRTFDARWVRTLDLSF